MSIRNTEDSEKRELKEYIDSQNDKNEYDPNQDKEERRELRKSYRKLFDKTNAKKKELASDENKDGIYMTLDKANTLFQNVKNVQEATLDSRVLVLSADLSAQKAKALRLGGESFRLDEFVSKLISFGKNEDFDREENEELNWKLIGQKAMRIGKRGHSIDFMLGPLMVERKQIKRAKTTRITRNKEDLVEPTKLQQGDIEKQDNETSNNVNAIYQELTKHEPINYFKFVTNPESFSQTVENIFYVSFLIRNAVAQIDITSGQPILTTKASPNTEDSTEIINKKQIIMGIDIGEWKEIIKTYEIKDTIIPTRRKNTNVGGSNKWY
ncbi:hypothetical protein K501DRAFT_252547 [Backusella circina FSU 941]|nr:hypothetical protein K501DRAFT_252547 [Backusella circina FSU 941]